MGGLVLPGLPVVGAGLPVVFVVVGGAATESALVVAGAAVVEERVPPDVPLRAVMTLESADFVRPLASMRSACFPESQPYYGCEREEQASVLGCTIRPL